MCIINGHHEGCSLSCSRAEHCMVRRRGHIFSRVCSSTSEQTPPTRYAPRHSQTSKPSFGTTARKPSKPQNRIGSFQPLQCSSPDQIFLHRLQSSLQPRTWKQSRPDISFGIEHAAQHLQGSPVKLPIACHLSPVLITPTV